MPAICWHEVCSKMKARGLKNIPIVDPAGRPVGILMRETRSAFFSRKPKTTNRCLCPRLRNDAPRISIARCLVGVNEIPEAKLNTDPFVLAVHTSKTHSFSKLPRESIMLLEGLGVEGDAHCGRTVQHRFDASQNPTKPNLRQVHLLQSELLDELEAGGFSVAPGQMGENISTRGIALLDLPAGTQLHIGSEAVVEITGLRTPCLLIEKFQKGLLPAVIRRGPEGELIRRVGVMGIVVCGGAVRPRDAIHVSLPGGEQRPLDPV